MTLTLFLLWFIPSVLMYLLITVSNDDLDGIDVDFNFIRSVKPRTNGDMLLVFFICFFPLINICVAFLAILIFLGECVSKWLKSRLTGLINQLKGERNNGSLG